MSTELIYVKILAAYLILCAIVGLLGRGRRMGGWGYFFGSIVLTPLIGMMLVMVSDKKRE